MGKLRDRLARFMVGRYGPDELYGGMMGLMLVLMALGAVIKTPVVGYLMWAVMILALARFMSRKVEARKRENEKYLAATKPLRKRLSHIGKRIGGIRRYRYRSCPQCGAFIELPRRKGRRTIDCPRCRRRFDVRILI